MGKSKNNGKQEQKQRERFCGNCNETKAVQPVMIVSGKTTWKNRCLTCDKYVED